MTALDTPPTRPTVVRLPTPDLSQEALARVTAAIADTAEQYDRSGEVPIQGLRVAHEAALLTASVGTQFGGPGLGPRQISRILVALGEGDPSVALMAANNLAAHAAQAANPHWPASFYERALHDSALRPTLINAVRAEPELGAPARGGIPATTVTRTAEGWVLNGRKAYATGGAGLAFHQVWVTAVEPRADSEHPRVGHVIVPADLPGIEWIPTWDHLGLRASNTHDVVYTEVLLPADAFVEVPRDAQGVYRDPAAQARGAGSLGHPSLYVGVARAARSAFAAFANSRIPTGLGRPIATTERIQAVAGEIDLQIAQAETLLYGSIERLDADEPEIEAQLSVVKAAIARSAVQAVQTAVAAIGNPGLSRHNSLERHLRDVLCVRVHPPQEDTALIASGRRVLGVG